MEKIKQHKYAIIIAALSILLFCCSCLFISAALNNKPTLDDRQATAYAQIDKDLVDNTATPVTTNTSVVIVQTTNTPRPTNTIAPTNTPQPTKTPVPTKQWVVLAELKGTDNKSSDTFEITGGKIRLTYTFTRDDFMLGAIYIMKEGTTLEDDGGIPVVLIMAKDNNKDSTLVVKKSGTYYLHVVASNTDYTITIEEER